MEPGRESKLRAIKVGDIFHAEAHNGASLLCQALAISDTTIQAQRMFMRDEILRFDRTTGFEEGETDAPLKTDSVAPPPDDSRYVILRAFMLSNVYWSDAVIEDEKKGVPAKIDSVAPLPDEIREVLERLDYRYNNNLNPTPTSARLTEAEKHALLFIDDHYRTNRI